MMFRIAAILTALAMGACDKKHPAPVTPPGTERGNEPAKPVSNPFVVDAWSSWNRCEPGSLVVHELESGGIKLTITKILEKKGDPRHVLKTETVVRNGEVENKTAGEEKIEKPRAPLEGKCLLCDTPGCAKNSPRWSVETLKIDGRELRCEVSDTPEKNCKGDPFPKTKLWYSDEVPGQLVRMETSNSRMICVRFEKK